RLVRHPGLDWRRSIEHLIRGHHTELAQPARRSDRRSYDHRVDFVPALLGNEYLHHLSRHGPVAQSGKLGGAIRSDYDRIAGGLGDLEGARTGLFADPTE